MELELTQSELMESRVLNCFDANTLQFKRTPDCNDTMNDMFAEASTTKVFEDFHFAIITLYTEVSFHELQQLVSDFLERAGIDRDSKESFWLSQAAFAGRTDKESVHEYYKNFNALSVENRQFALHSGVLTATFYFLQSESTHYHVLEEARKIVESIPVDRFGIPSNILYLELVQLQSAMKMQAPENYLLQTVSESEYGARQAAQALAEIHAHCENEPNLCEVVGGSEEQFKEIIRANLDNTLFSKEERSQMKTLLDVI